MPWARVAAAVMIFSCASMVISSVISKPRHRAPANSIASQRSASSGAPSSASSRNIFGTDVISFAPYTPVLDELEHGACHRKSRDKKQQMKEFFGEFVLIRDAKPGALIHFLSGRIGNETPQTI